MKLKHFFIALALLPSYVFADWLPVGKVEYNWGPFHIYNVTLSTETGHYEANQRPLMLTLQYEKPVEGKNFAITLMKEIDNKTYKDINSDQVVKDLQSILPDLRPNDVLHYVALPDRGYFIYNDTVLNKEFLGDINNAIVDIWLSPNSKYIVEKDKLTGKSTEKQNIKPITETPEVAPLEQENADPPMPTEQKHGEIKNRYKKAVKIPLFC
ncbi:hypothetical protein EDC44_11175 [Cricetibacter osteomyelitidis]|uniref:Chalcone isomerase-like protein n=1 Tax=Cricetibacter osteomyelitidis TaxID=1521931 RepID=A0A4R2T1B4_9PAST|nr:hypothetical protein [Cricetibacter osteomyelitidis]TCP95121.1 hypothetical protein EDC44_11175 [Cricetibacter osteomyelitidis]